MWGLAGKSPQQDDGRRPPALCREAEKLVAWSRGKTEGRRDNLQLCQGAAETEEAAPRHRVLVVQAGHPRGTGPCFTRVLHQRGWERAHVMMRGGEQRALQHLPTPPMVRGENHGMSRKARLGSAGTTWG